MRRNQEILTFKASPKSVDMSTRTLNEVLIAQVGEAKGHGVHIEGTFLDKLVELTANGAKTNFGHNWNNLGYQLGRISDIKRQGDKATGNLNIYQNADKSPKMTGMGTWVLNQANEDPESIMLSLTFKPAYYYQRDENGSEIVLRTDYWGDVTQEYLDRPVFVALGKVYSIDVVDAGAVTDAMFSEENDNIFKRFLRAIKTPLSKRRPDPDDDDDIFLNERNDGGYVWVGNKKFTAIDISVLLSNIENLGTQANAAKTTITELKAVIKDLEGEPAAEPTSGETNGFVAIPDSKTPTADRFNATINNSLRKKAAV